MGRVIDRFGLTASISLEAMQILKVINHNAMPEHSSRTWTDRLAMVWMFSSPQLHWPPLDMRRHKSSG